ncbi:uroporphyrinogen decarboxylase (URO-D) [Oxobacter pfennigii]|uniref:Uroporphyrinogen decarboxylase (URO-D) n=1 Tax=Oxobacter pfennigii TaxID=36849 RepID=A0A0P8W1U5_9CLOT|nr:uroporphyrinogen decarboxylase family protein [Oxobacter pfennigii]KPU42479.1 uroporphyrinogen decarboxylase (URO-D) [Oxobacter pfennigii]
MIDPKALYQERLDDIIATTNHKEPKRVPVMANMSYWTLAYANAKFRDVYKDGDLLAEKYTKFLDDIYFDSTFFVGISTPFEIIEILGSKSFFISEDGTTLQHHENAAMLPEDYPEFIKDPMKFMIDVLALRKFPNLNKSREEAYETLKTALKAYVNWRACNAKVSALAKGKYGLVEVTGPSKAYAPADLIFDRLRGFAGMLTDIRRAPGLLEEAVNALSPIYTNLATSSINSPFPYSRSTLHCPTYLGAKNFERFFWSTYKEMLLKIHEKGCKTLMFLEGEWEKYYDYINELPKSSALGFIEYDDVIEAKKRVGNTITIVGGVPLNKLRFAPKQECIDFAKRIIDECAPGGGFIFSTDKALISKDDVNIDNFRAVNEFVHEYGKY